MILIITHKQIQGFQDNVSHHKETAFPNISVPIIVKAGWNLVSLPVNVQDVSVQNIFPTSISPAYAYKNRYSVEDTIKRCDGYWLKFAEDDTVWIDGQKKYIDTIYLNQGWNIIGSSFRKVSINDIQTIPSDIIGSNYYTYEPDVGYSIADTIEPGKAYWIKAKQAGIGIMSPSWKNLGFDGMYAKRLQFSEPYVYVCARKDGLWRKNIRQESIDWEYLGFADTNLTVGEGVYDVVINRHNNNWLLVTFYEDFGISHTVFRSYDGGDSWLPADSGLGISGTPYYQQQNLFLNHPNHILASGGAYIARTTDFGDSWHLITANNVLFIEAFEYHRVFFDNIWMGGESGFWSGIVEKSTDSGFNWFSVYGDWMSPTIYDIALDPVDANIAYISEGAQILKTIDGGQNWTKNGFGNVLLSHKNISGKLLAAGLGFFIKITYDYGLTWHQIEKPIPSNIYVLDMIWDEQKEIIYIGTHSGVYSFEP